MGRRRRKARGLLLRGYNEEVSKGGLIIKKKKTYPIKKSVVVIHRAVVAEELRPD